MLISASYILLPTNNQVSIMKKNITLIKINTNDLSCTDFLIQPRDLCKSHIMLQQESINALRHAASVISIKSNNKYSLVVTRGYIVWGFVRQWRGWIAKMIFAVLFGENKKDVDLLFSANGHDSGLSVDVCLYDHERRTIIKFLPWKNVFISRDQATLLQHKHKDLVTLLNAAMTQAGFIGHPDPREQLQSHYRLVH
jgi:D-alanyl-D-alanine dipeptidase